MPGQDKTGPLGQGAMTGRGLGLCGGGLGLRQGFGRGLGRGRSFAWRARAIQEIQPTVITEKQEKQYLNQELEVLKEEMKEIEKRLKDLKD